MLKRLSLEQIAENLTAGAPIAAKIRQRIPLTREEQWQRERTLVNQDMLRLALLDRGAGFAPLALEVGANFVGGDDIVLFVQDPDVDRRLSFVETVKQAPLKWLIPAILTMSEPEATEDDKRRHARAQADFATLPEVERDLKERGKQWFSLGEGWRFRQATEEVVVWLNPRDQKHDKFGWYTLAELRQWAEDNGPVKNVRSHKSPV